MNALSEMLSFDFMQRAFLVGTLIAAATAAVGVFVVQRGVAFIGDGIAHAAFGGIGIGLWMGIASDQIIWAALPFSLAVALAISTSARRGRLSEDVATGIFFSLSLAVGALFLSLRPPDASPVSVESLLFGSILAVSSSEIGIILTLIALSFVFLIWSFPKLAYATFSPELAKLSGIRVSWIENGLFLVTALLVVVSVKTVGAALVSAFLILPAVISGFFMNRVTRRVIFSSAVAVLGAWMGLLLSYFFSVPSGAAIVLSLGGLLVAALLINTAFRS